MTDKEWTRAATICLLGQFLVPTENLVRAPTVDLHTVEDFHQAELLSSWCIKRWLCDQVLRL